MRTTTRLRAALAVAVEDGRDQSEVAAAYGVSWPTVQGRCWGKREPGDLVRPPPARTAMSCIGGRKTRAPRGESESL
jgi:hypothetical protein